MTRAPTRNTLAALLIPLQHEAVVLPGGLALRKAVRAVHQLDHLPTQQEVLAILEKWRPYRSLATSHLFSAAFGRSTPPARQDHERIQAEAPLVARIGSA